MLNVKPRNLVFSKTYSTESDEIIITSTDRNGRPLEREDKVNLTFLINKWKCNVFLQSNKRENVKEYTFLSFARNLSSEYGKQLLDTHT